MSRQEPTPIPRGGRAASGALRRATNMLRRGRYEEALTTLDQALTLGADPYDCYIRKAEAYQSMGMHEQALSEAAKAAEVHPTALRAHETMATIHLKMGDFTAAIDSIRTLLKLVPRSVTARSALSLAYVGTGDFEAALRVTSEMIRLDPADPIHRLKRAAILEHLGDVRHALLDLEEALELLDDPALALDVRQHIETLDTLEIGRVLALAEEDVIFRVQLQRDAARAVADRGYALSPWGLARLEDAMEEFGRTQRSETRVPRYH